MRSGGFDEHRQTHFPMALPGGVEVRAVDAATGWTVAHSLSDQVFTPLAELGLVAYSPPPPLLAEAQAHHGEQLVFYDAAGEPIGWSIGHQHEPDTFFMLWTGILPAHQNQGLYSAFLRHFIDYCRALGYARIASTHMVNNTRVIVAKMKAGFVASAMELDERWGAMLRLTYYIDESRKRGLESAFSLPNYDQPDETRPALRERPAPDTT